MTAPVVAYYTTAKFRDAKGQTARMRLLIGAATASAWITATGTLQTALAAISNASVDVAPDSFPTHTYGTAANYQDVADKAVLTFLDVSGGIHRFKVPAPKTTCFLADQETWDNSGAMATLTAFFAASVYARSTDASPLTFVGGLRSRVKMPRKFNIFTLNPAETGPGE